MPSELLAFLMDNSVGLAILGSMWWLERKDRKAAEEKLQTVTERHTELWRELFEKANGGA